MQVKIDTKEKFHVITPIDADLSATMTDGIEVSLLPYLQNTVKNVVFNMHHVQHIDEAAASKLLQIQQKFYENNASFLICEIAKPIEEFLSDKDLLELINMTPTESEAGDIVQMEEIERELLDEE